MAGEATGTVRWGTEWADFRKAVRKCSFDGVDGGKGARQALRRELERAAARLLGVVMTSRVPPASPDPVEQFQWVARFTAANGWTDPPFRFGPKATELLFTWFGSRPESNDPVLLEERLRTLENGLRPLLLDECCRHDWLTRRLPPSCRRPPG